MKNINDSLIHRIKMLKVYENIGQKLSEKILYVQSPYLPIDLPISCSYYYQGLHRDYILQQGFSCPDPFVVPLPRPLVMGSQYGNSVCHSLAMLTQKGD